MTCAPPSFRIHVGKSINIPVLLLRLLVNFHICVDLPHKGTCSHVSNGTTHYSQGSAEHGHVAKVEGCLEQPVHLSFKEVVVKGVHININSSGCSREETCPLPSVVFSIEQEVCTHDGDTHSHNAQDDQDQHHETIHIVDFVGPKRCEDEVHFNENGPKREDSSKADDDSRLHEPFLLWDWPRHGVHPAGKVWLARQIPPQNRPHEV